MSQTLPGQDYPKCSSIPSLGDSEKTQRLSLRPTDSTHLNYKAENLTLKYGDPLSRAGPPWCVNAFRFTPIYKFSYILRQT